MKLELAAICGLEKQKKIFKKFNVFLKQFANKSKNNVQVEQMIILSIKEFL